MPRLERKIGFIGNKEKILADAPGKAAPATALLHFDSGRVVTLDDATHHILCLGTTGSGKSTNLIFPALYQLFGNKSFGLIVDIKGTLRRHVKALARATGREADLVEYGTSPDALPLNLLNGINRHNLREFLQQLTTQNFQNNTHNLDWHLKGVASAADCGQLLIYLASVSNEFSLNMRLISEMINAPKDAQKLYAYYLENVYDNNDLEQRRFVDSINNNRFHVLKKVDNASSLGNATLEEQLSWGLQGVRDGLRNFLEAPGIEAKFCCPGAPALTFTDSILAGKIILLRFELATGPIGANLARTMLSNYYSCIYDLGITLPKDKKSFICIDEFQEIADLSNGRFSDASFIALAREYNCIFMTATQSMSALVAKGEETAAVTSFVSNCNQKIIFYNDDPLTQEIVSRHAPNLVLADLKPGEAFVSTYDATKREHAHGMDSLKNSYEAVHAILENAQTDNPRNLGERAALPEQKSLFELTEDVKMKSATHNNRHGWTDEKSPREKKQEQVIRPPLSEGARMLLEKFSELFLENEDEICMNVPKGWLKATERALTAFKDVGMPVKIAGLRIYERGLRADIGKYGGTDSMDAINVLNKFLKNADSLCIICGCPVKNTKPDEDEDDLADLYDHTHKASLQLCSACQKKFGLMNAE